MEPSDNTHHRSSDTDSEKDSAWVPFVDTLESALSANDDHSDENTDPDFLTRLRKSGLLWIILAVIAIAALVQVVRVGYRALYLDTQAKQPAHRIDGQAGQKPATLETVVRDYLEADSIKKKLPWIRDPKRVLPLMQDHYSKHPLAGQQFDRILSQDKITNKQASFTYLSIAQKDGTTRNLSLEHLDDGELKVDWETDVHYMPMTWEEIINLPPGAPAVDVRVYLSNTDDRQKAKYDRIIGIIAPRKVMEQLNPLENASVFKSFRLVPHNRKQPLLAYVRHNGLIHRNLNEYLRGRFKYDPDGEPMILRIRVQDDMDARTGVIIEKVVSYSWIIPSTGDQPSLPTPAPSQ